MIQSGRSLNVQRTFTRFDSIESSFPFVLFSHSTSRAVIRFARKQVDKLDCMTVVLVQPSHETKLLFFFWWLLCFLFLYFLIQYCREILTRTSRIPISTTIAFYLYYMINRVYGAFSIDTICNCFNPLLWLISLVT